MIIQFRPCYRWLPVVFVGLLLLQAAPPGSAAEQRLLVVGDSISAAYGMSLEQGWVALLARRLEERDAGLVTVNASISGETTNGALRRLPALLEEHRPAIVIIELGGNDGLRGFPIKQFRGNLSQLARLSRDAGAEVILLPMEIPPNYGSRYTASFRESYSLVAQDTGSTLGTFLLDGVAAVPGMMQADGIHPTVKAQEVLLDNVWPSLLAVLEPP